ncbi:AhpC/TSA family protein [Pseudarcicella hirudinis]|uniref:AhpC/TSA family protein n=1 Tax=Pseudarcicella hirudinis TaxID=1079859 RepID=A0A1I5QBR7_9BACT|nr:thioredoxin family protein [Pseudarcicella hirudinis]SFP43754.1 AhpC/TSA family protein [Pseudarcicella hirudinis]
MKTLFNKVRFLGLALVILSGLSFIFAFSEKHINPQGYEIGDAVSDFHLRSVDGKMVSLADNRTAKGYIIVFTCHHCPFSRAYEGRIIALNQKFANQGFPVLAINPNDPSAYEEDSFENMKAVAKSKGYTFTYVQDEKQDVAKAFGASRTPSVYVIKKENDRFILQYVGAIDDNSQDAGSATKKYVEEAVNNLLAGKPVVTNFTKSVGCAIKWKGL